MKATKVTIVEIEKIVEDPESPRGFNGVLSSVISFSSESSSETATTRPLMLLVSVKSAFTPYPISTSKPPSKNIHRAVRYPVDEFLPVASGRA